MGIREKLFGNMSIKQKIKLAALIIIIAAVVTETCFLFLLYREAVISSHLRDSVDLLKGKFEIVLLTNDYVRNHTERAKEQWLSRHAALGELIKKWEFNDREEQAILESIKEGHRDVESQFKIMMEIHKDSENAPGHSEAGREFEDRLAGQIMVKAQSIVSSAFNLAESELAQSTRFDHIRGWLLGVSLLVFVLIFGGIMYVGWQVAIKISSTIGAVSSSTTEISATVSQHERVAVQQASMVNEATTTMEELTVSAQKMSEQAAAAADLAQQALQQAGEGAETVRQAMKGMEGLGRKVGETADRMLKLGEQTVLIGNLAEMVKDLAGEINMLALNAAVEAARAGEQGRGFAVVAGEVRKLARESKNSAEQAQNLVTEIQKAANSTIMKMDEGSKSLEDVSGFSRNLEALFDDLSEGAHRVYENAQQVLMNARQQAAAISQVVEAMTELNVGARETATGINQTKVGIDDIDGVMQDMKKMV